MIRKITHFILVWIAAPFGSLSSFENRHKHVLTIIFMIGFWSMSAQYTAMDM